MYTKAQYQWFNSRGGCYKALTTSDQDYIAPMCHLQTSVIEQGENKISPGENSQALTNLISHICT